jgi:Leucine-rich repeat (LRR) protein
MPDYQVIELLCSAQEANIALAEQLCATNQWKIKTILEKYGYPEIGLSQPKQFLRPKLEIRSKNIPKLPDLLPEGLVEINFYDNQLTALPAKLPSKLENFYCQNNQIASFPLAFPDSLKAFNCADNQLVAVPANLPDSLETLNCSKNQLTALPEHLPKSLQTLYCGDNQLETLPPLPENLDRLDCENNQLKALPEHFPNTITVLNCSNNPDLQFSDLKSTGLKFIMAANCPHFSPDILPEGFVEIEEGTWYAG